MPLQQVGIRNGHVVFEVTTKKGAFLCFRIFRNDKIGDASAAIERKTLEEALQFADRGK